MFLAIYLVTNMGLSKRWWPHTKRVKPAATDKNKHENLGYYTASTALSYNSLVQQRS